MAEKEEQKQGKGGFWGYLKHKDMDFYPTGGLRWWILFLVMLVWAVQQFDNMKMGPVLMFLMEDFNLDLSGWGNLAVAAGIGGAIAAGVMGNWGDKYGRRPMLVWPVIIYAFIAAGTALAPNYYTVAILYVLGYSLVNGMMPAINAAARDITPQMGRGMVFSFISIAITIGTLLANWVAAFTIPIWPGWRPQYWIATGFAAIIAIIMAYFYRDLSTKVRGQIVKDQVDALSTGLKSSGFASIEEAQKKGALIYKDIRMWILAGAMIFWAVPYVSVAYYVPTYLTTYYGVEASMAATITSYFWLVFTISVLGSGWLSDKMRCRKIVTAFGGITTGIGFLIAARLPVGSSFGTLAFWWSVTGFFSGFIYPAWCAIMSENAEEISPFAVSRAFGISGVLGVVGMAILNFGLPQVVARWGWPMWMGPIAMISCFIIAAMMFAGRGPWWIPKDTKVTHAA